MLLWHGTTKTAAETIAEEWGGLDMDSVCQILQNCRSVLEIYPFKLHHLGLGPGMSYFFTIRHAVNPLKRVQFQDPSLQGRVQTFTERSDAKLSWHAYHTYLLLFGRLCKKAHRQKGQCFIQCLQLF